MPPQARGRPAWRGTFGQARPATLAGLPLPPGPMPAHDHGRPLKQWRYVAVLCSELILGCGAVRIGPARQAFWTAWDRRRGRMYERTALGRGNLLLEPGRVRLLERDVQVDLRLEEEAGIETVCPTGASYAWTRKQGGVPARGTVVLAGEPMPLRGLAVIDDTAAYYARHTRWRWSAGVGRAQDGRSVAWNLVEGVNDPLRGSERTVWLDGEPHEPPPARFASDLDGVDGLRFDAEATRERRENLLLVRSRLRQSFGRFSGELPQGLALAEGLGVMEAHDVRW